MPLRQHCPSLSFPAMSGNWREANDRRRPVADLQPCYRIDPARPHWIAVCAVTVAPAGCSGPSNTPVPGPVLQPGQSIDATNRSESVRVSYTPTQKRKFEWDGRSRLVTLIARPVLGSANASLCLSGSRVPHHGQKCTAVWPICSRRNGPPTQPATPGCAPFRPPISDRKGSIGRSWVSIVRLAAP